MIISIKLKSLDSKIDNRYSIFLSSKNLKINSYGQILENGKEIKVYTKTPLLHLKDRYAELRIYGFKSKYTVCTDIDKIQ